MKINRVNRAGKTIRELRRQALLTQSELAEKLGLHKQTISFWETNVRFPSLPSLRRLAELLPDARAEIVALVTKAA